MIQRYDIDEVQTYKYKSRGIREPDISFWKGGGTETGAWEDIDGEWVKHKDVEKLETALDQKDKKIAELLEYKKTAEELANDFLDADMERNRLRDALVEITLVIGEVKDGDSVQDMLHRKCKKYEAIAHKAIQEKSNG